MFLKLPVLRVWEEVTESGCPKKTEYKNSVIYNKDKFSNSIQKPGKMANKSFN